MCILEVGKVLMYEFHLIMLKKYDNKPKLLFPGTDRLMYKIKTGDVKKILAAIIKCLILVII